MRVRARVRVLSREFVDRVEHSAKSKDTLALMGGFPSVTLYSLLANRQVRDTALMRLRLERIADAIQFPRDQIYAVEL